MAIRAPDGANKNTQKKRYWFIAKNTLICKLTFIHVYGKTGQSAR